MTPHEAIDRLTLVLRDEREAIRVIDGSRVEELADEKGRLLSQLTREALRGDEHLARRFRDSAEELRNNAVILAHARNCLREVLRGGSLQTAPPTYRADGILGGSQPNRLSITG